MRVAGWLSGQSLAKKGQNEWDSVIEKKPLEQLSDSSRKLQGIRQLLTEKKAVRYTAADSVKCLR